MRACSGEVAIRECIGVGGDVYESLKELQESAPRYESLLADLMSIRCTGCADIMPC